MREDYWVLEDSSNFEKRKEYFPWTDKEVSFLKENYNKKPVKEIANKLMRPEASVRSKIYREGLKKNKFCLNSSMLVSIIVTIILSIIIQIIFYYF